MQNPFSSFLRHPTKDITSIPRYKTKAGRHEGLNIKDLRKRRAKNKQGRKSRRLNHLSSR